MKKITQKILGAVVVVAALGSGAFAADEHEASGTVNSVDKERKTLNITHGPIKSMGMSGMTMDFNVADPAMLNEVKPGQKIEFVLTADKKGRFVIVDLQ